MIRFSNLAVGSHFRFFRTEVESPGPVRKKVSARCFVEVRPRNGASKRARPEKRCLQSTKAFVQPVRHKIRGGMSFGNVNGRGETYTGYLIGHRGKVADTEVTAPTPQEAQRKLDEKWPKYLGLDAVVRSDRTSDGTVWGPGRGRVVAIRELKKWVRTGH